MAINGPASGHSSRFFGAAGLALNVVVMLIDMAVFVLLVFTGTTNKSIHTDKELAVFISGKLDRPI